MKVERISESTYRVFEGTLDDLAAHLARRGWVRHEPRSAHEHSRWWFGARQALIIAYRSGTILAQGRDPWLAFVALREFIIEARGINEQPPWRGGRSGIRQNSNRG